MSTQDKPSNIDELLESQRRVWDAAEQADNEIPFGWESSIASTLRTIREERGWSQLFASDRLRDLWGIEMHQTTLAKLEAGKRPIRLAELYALATLYGHTVTTVLARQQDAQDRAPATLPGEAEIDAWYFDALAEYEEAVRNSMEFLKNSINSLVLRRLYLRSTVDLLSLSARGQVEQLEASEWGTIDSSGEADAAAADSDQ